MREGGIVKLNEYEGGELHFESLSAAILSDERIRDRTDEAENEIRYLHITPRQTGRRTSLSYAKSRQRAALLLDQDNVVDRHKL